MLQTRSLVDAKRTAEAQETEVYLSKVDAPELPPEFEQTALALPRGEIANYRDTATKDCVHVREFDDHWKIHVDSYNPDRGFGIQHAIEDAPAYTALTVGLIAGYWKYSHG